MKRKYQRELVRLACVCLCLFWFPLHAQLIELPNIELISEKDGLPFNSTNVIVQDRQGFIWIGSSDGLARYDGYSFLTFQYDPSNKNSLPNNTIIALAVDKKGFIWASHLGGFLSRIDPIKHTIWYTKIPRAEESVCRKIFCDSKGRVWCYLDFLGMFIFDGNTFNYVASLKDLPSNAPAEGKWYNIVTDIVEGNDGKFWITSANGLYSFSPENKVFKKESSLSNDERVPVSLHKILLDDANGCWLATYGNGLIYYNRINGAYEKYLFQPTSSGTTNIINGLARKSETEIWVATNGKGLGLFNTVTKKYIFYYEEDAIDAGPLSADMMVDRDGIVWVLSDKGILKWNVNGNNFLFKKLKVSRSDNLAYYGVSDILEDSLTGRTIIGTQYTEGLFIITSNGTILKRAIEKYPNAEEYMLVTDLMHDRDGKIWVVTRDYVYELTTDNQLIKVNGINSLLRPNQVPYFSRLLQSTNGDLWLGSRNGVFHKSINGPWERLLADTTNALASNRVLRLAEDAQHRIWMAHGVEGVTVYNPKDKSFRNYKHLPNDSSSLVSNIFTDMASTANGEIWIATQEGISHYNSQRDAFDNFNLASGLPSQVVASINTDDDNNIWAMTNKGLVRMDGRTNRISLYGFKDGLQGIYGSFLMRKGDHNKMYLCTFQGFYTFSPKQVAKSGNKPVPVIITAVKNLTTLKNQYNTTHKTVVEYNNNAISIEFAALNYLSPLNNRYRFKMEGLNRGWTETDNNVVTFSGLPSGEYTFMVYLAGGDAIGQCARLQIVVTTPFWKQIWFRVLVITLIVAISFWAYRARLRAVRQEEKLKTDFNKKLAEVEMKALKAQMSPHFIFNSLNSINRYIIKSEPEKASLYLTKFSKLIRLILDNSNSKIISLDQELTALKLYIELEALRFNEKFSYTLSVKEDLNPHSIGVPPMIIQPFIENAIWHGLLHKDTPGKLSISIERYGHGLQCIIEDDGVGRKRAAELKSKSVNKEKSYGMKITSDRLNMLNGESKVSSVEIIDLTDAHGNACGTKVIVKIMSAELEPEF